MLKKSDESTKLLLIGIVFLFMILYILITSIGDSKKENYDFILDYIKTINENYTLNVSMASKNIIYSKDKEIEVIESNEFENKKYVMYQNKIYVVKDNSKLEIIESSNDLVDKYYYDLKLLNNVITYCKFRRDYGSNIACFIKSDDYNKELLSLYGLGRAYDKDIYITFITSDNIINKMTIDYGNEKINIEFDMKTPNDYSYLKEMIK